MSIFKQIIVLVFLVALGGAGFLVYEQYAPDTEASNGDGGRGRGGSAILVDLAPVTRQVVERRVEAVGTTLAARAVSIVPQASGRVEEIDFTPGARIDKGAVLVRLDDDIERANLTQAKAELEEITLRLTRSQTLRANNAVTQATIDKLIAEKAAAEAEYERARKRLADRVVRAPFAGIVGFNRVDVGARVDDKTVVTTLDDLSEIDVEFAVPETLFGRVRSGLPVVADSAAFPGQTFNGVVDTIDSRIDAVSRAFMVRARIPNPDFALPAGMFMHLVVVLETRSALMVPEEAILAQGGKTLAFVIEDGKAKRRTVVLGARQNGLVEVTDGVAENEQIVTGGLQRLRDGAAVRVAGQGGKGGQGGQGGQGDKRGAKP